MTALFLGALAALVCIAAYAILRRDPDSLDAALREELGLPPREDVL